MHLGLLANAREGSLDPATAAAFPYLPPAQQKGELSIQATQKEIEKRQLQLKNVTDLGEGLKTVLKGKESLVNDKVTLLSSNWIAVTSRAEEWFNLLMHPPKDGCQQMMIKRQNYYR
uniref:Uncharacterized protein n=1 Tax=Sphaerodactylus townsendi TaxID=933632 RepID=A0ACB8FHJ7_9SAUR